MDMISCPDEVHCLRGERKLNTHSKGCKISIMMSAVKMWSVGLSKDLTNHVRMRELAAGEMRRA